MVFEDIARPSSQRKLPIASVHDRFLAFAFDLCLWVPIGFLLLKPLWKRLQYLSITASASHEMMGLFALTALLGVVLFVLAQGLMTWFWGATPGKRIFHLEVVTFEGQRRPSLGACVTRSAVQIIEFALMGVPFLELMSHVDRRPWHDRVAETLVVTHKALGGEAPHWLEQRFFRNLYWGFAFIACVYLGTQLQTFFRSIAHGDMKRSELVREGYLCSELTTALSSEVAKDPSRRLDMGIALYIGGQITGKCLDSEADFVIWTQDRESLPWAHLARAMFFQEQGKDNEAELQKVCALGGEASVVCSLAEWQRTQVAPKEGLADQTWVYRVSRLNDLLRAGRFESVGEFVNLHDWPEGLASVAQGKRLQSLWMTGTDREFQIGLDLLRVGWGLEARMKVEAWSCLAQLTKNCGTQKATACQALRDDMDREAQTEWPQPVVLARARESLCSNRHEPGLQAAVGRAFREQADQDNWVFHWLDNKPVSNRARWSKIYEGARRLTADDWLFGQALWALASSAEQADHFQKLDGLFSKGASDDVFWWIAHREYQARAKGLGFDPQGTVKMRAPTSSEMKKPAKDSP